MKPVVAQENLRTGTETDLRGAMEVADRLRFAIKGNQIPVVGKIAASGVAECPSSAQTARELLATADAGLYTGTQPRGSSAVSRVELRTGDERTVRGLRIPGAISRPNLRRRNAGTRT